jgi:GMP synthase-like glutamine amidotransferase
MRILAVLNHDDVPPALVGERVVARGGTLVEVNPHDGGGLPQGDDGFDAILVLGGVMSAADHDGYPAFRPVTELLRAFHGAGKPVLGICLGSQLLAMAFGKPVFRHREVEFGFLPLQVTEAGAADPLLQGLAGAPHIFQWHEDTFELPDQAVLLMTGEGCRNQAFRVGASSYGFQCHFEATDEAIRRWIRLGRAELERELGPRAAGIEDEIAAQSARNMAAARAFACAVSDRWLDLVERRKAAPG